MTFMVFAPQKCAQLHGCLDNGEGAVGVQWYNI
jgi:hypothetical protein